MTPLEPIDQSPEARLHLEREKRRARQMRCKRKARQKRDRKHQLLGEWAW